jgi:hypothetical protein
MNANAAGDISLLNRVGLALFSLIIKARERARVPKFGAASANIRLHEGNDETALGCEAGLAGLFPQR